MSPLVLAALLAVTGLQEPAADFRFPTEPIAPRAAALGGSGAAVSFDAEASLNPATLAGAHRASLHCFQGYSGYRGFVVAAGVPLPGGVVIGAAVRHFDYGNVIEDDLGSGSGDLDVREEAYGATAAVRLPAGFTLGAAVRRLSATYFGSATIATTYALGLALAPAASTRIGLALRELGGAARNRGAGTRYELPTRIRFGAAQRIRLAASELTTLVDVEAGVRGRAEPAVHVGVEWSPVPILALRAGHAGLANPDVEAARSTQWSAGLGVGIGSVELGAGARFGGSAIGTELFIGLDAFR